MEMVTRENKSHEISTFQEIGKKKKGGAWEEGNLAFLFIILHKTSIQ